MLPRGPCARPSSDSTLLLLCQVRESCRYARCRYASCVITWYWHSASEDLMSFTRSPSLPARPLSGPIAVRLFRAAGEGGPRVSPTSWLGPVSARTSPLVTHRIVSGICMVSDLPWWHPGCVFSSSRSCMLARRRLTHLRRLERPCKLTVGQIDVFLHTAPGHAHWLRAFREP